ncbi:RrF2 family transcriptional regulator [Flavobacteriaceae bacterium 14752]|uniref:RrF2 family transcriptional regulator n=1 Tax=Mesohalobacter salilacus TaxID=2491711 RepID=UPI000F63A9E3|nr:Rrf2 family transcriptional regulator [Flavobacteriaceae bacterium 14752]
MFSKSCEYAIKVMAFIAFRQAKSKELIGLDPISEAIDSPKAFTAKILQQLTKAELLKSVRGRTGGFYLDQNREIVIADIVRAIDGSKILDGCLLGFGECQDENPCVLHHQIKKERSSLKNRLNSTDIYTIAKRVSRKKAYFKE